MSKAWKSGPPAWRPLVAVGATVAVIAGLLLGLGRVGDEARRRVGPRERYAVRFADVDCDAPPGLDRAAFLAEVRYAANFPESFNLFDPADVDRVKAAFAAHPWVKAVDGIDVEPPKRVRVRLTFRVPVLAVKTAAGDVRLVDGGAVLLPLAAPANLPHLLTPVRAPTTAAGVVWADETVRRAVELVPAYHPRTLEETPAGWRLTLADGKVLVVGP